MKKYKLLDLSFYPDKSCSKYYEPKAIEWDRSPYKGEDQVVFTDLCLDLHKIQKYQNAFKVAWVIEPIVINQYPYQYLTQTDHNFDLVLTHHKVMLDKIKNAMYYPFGGSWIEHNDWGSYKKTKRLSMVFSNKNYTVGHQMRHQVAQIGKDKMDLFGSGARPVDKKLDALKDYAFSVAIENCSTHGYFTEKLIDCFAAGTVPIYWGDPSITEIFDKRGMIITESIQDVLSAVESVTLDQYQEYEPYVKKNQEIAQTYKVAEDWIFENILDNIQKIC